MKTLIAAFGLIMGTQSAFAAPRPPKIPTMVHSFSVQFDDPASRPSESKDQVVTVTGKAAGLNLCTKPFSRVMVEQEKSTDGKNLIVVKIFAPVGLLDVVCEDDSPVLVPFNATLTIAKDQLGSTYIANVANEVANLSLEDMTKAQTCESEAGVIQPTACHYSFNPAE